MIDGGRLDSAQNSKIFDTLKSKSVFFSQTITYSPHTIAAMHAVLVVRTERELVRIAIGLHSNLKKIDSKL